MKGVLASGSDALEFLAATFIGEGVPRREQHSPSSAPIFFVHRSYAKISSARKPRLKKNLFCKKTKSCASLDTNANPRGVGVELTRPVSIGMTTTVVVTSANEVPMPGRKES